MSKVFFKPASLATVMLLGLFGCDSSTHSNEGKAQPEHPQHKIDSQGLLVLSSSGNNLVHVYDIKHKKMLTSFDSKKPVHSIYASPNQRYAVLLQRNDHQISFIDGGLYQEDHADHLHDYQQAPALSGFVLKGIAPTHYEVHGNQAAIFFDGAAAPMQAAGVTLLTDADIAAAKTSASLTLPLNMHGTAEPRGSHLLTTYRPADAANTLPTQVEWYQQEGNSFKLKERFSEQCPGLHGSYSVKDYSLFGCIDGVLVVQQKADELSAVKLANPAGMTGRIGTLTGHKNLTQVIGFAGQDMYLIDPVSLTMQKLDWRQGGTQTRVSYAMSSDGDYFVQLDNSGAVTIQQVATGYSIKAKLALLNNIDSSNPPVIAVNGQNDDIFITDPANKQLLQLDLTSLAVSKLPLEITPAKMTWLGIRQPAP